MFLELGDPIPTPMQLYVDNRAAVILGSEPRHDRRIKHMDVRYHWIREKHGSLFNLKWISGELNAADIFTKALPKIKHLEGIKLLGMSQPEPNQ